MYIQNTNTYTTKNFVFINTIQIQYKYNTNTIHIHYKHNTNTIQIQYKYNVELCIVKSSYTYKRVLLKINFVFIFKSGIGLKKGDCIYQLNTIPQLLGTIPQLRKYNPTWIVLCIFNLTSKKMQSQLKFSWCCLLMFIMTMISHGYVLFDYEGVEGYNDDNVLGQRILKKIFHWQEKEVLTNKQRSLTRREGVNK